MLATLSALFFSGKGRGNREALEGLLQGVGSLEGSRGLLSWDFRPCKVMNPPSLVEGTTGGVVIEADARLHGMQWRQFPLRVVFEPLLLFCLDLLLPGDLMTSQRGVSTSLVCSGLFLTTHLHGNWS